MNWNYSLIFIILVFLGCKSSYQYSYFDNSPNYRESDLKRLGVLKEQNLIQFTSIFINDSVVITNEKLDTVCKIKISTSEIHGFSPINCVLNKETVIVNISNRKDKFRVKKSDLEKYRFIYVGSYPKRDIRETIDIEALSNSNYYIEFTNDLRIPPHNKN